MLYTGIIIDVENESSLYADYMGSLLNTNAEKALAAYSQNAGATDAASSTEPAAAGSSE